MPVQHTPGPWKFEDGYVRSADGDIVADPYTMPTADAGDAMEANGHLLAAAPDMLAALRAILFQAIQGKVIERDACIAQARAAIAKATGN